MAMKRRKSSFSEVGVRARVFRPSGSPSGLNLSKVLHPIEERITPIGERPLGYKVHYKVSSVKKWITPTDRPSDREASQ